MYQNAQSIQGLKFCSYLCREKRFFQSKLTKFQRNNEEVVTVKTPIKPVLHIDRLLDIKIRFGTHMEKLCTI